MNANRSTRANGFAMRGRGYGTLVCAAFGAYWASSSRAAWPPAFVAAGYATIALITAALIIAGIALIRRSREQPRITDASPEQRRRTGRYFAAVFVAEIFAMNIAAYALVAHHLQQYLVPAVAIIVGLHFYPLARLFRAPHFDITASLMTLAGIGGVVFIACGSAAIPVTAAVDALCAVTLWGTGLVSWLSTMRSYRGTDEAEQLSV